MSKVFLNYKIQQHNLLHYRESHLHTSKDVNWPLNTPSAYTGGRATAWQQERYVGVDSQVKHAWNLGWGNLSTS